MQASFVSRRSSQAYSEMHDNNLPPDEEENGEVKRESDAGFNPKEEDKGEKRVAINRVNREQDFV